MDESGVPLCIRCETPMVEGFTPIVARQDAPPSVIRWYPGVFGPVGWLGFRRVTREQTQQSISVRTYRCPACGYLESYATPEARQD